MRGDNDPHTHHSDMYRVIQLSNEKQETGNKMKINRDKNQ